MPKKLDRCVEKIKKKKGVKNPYAICNKAIKGQNSKTRKKV